MLRVPVALLLFAPMIYAQTQPATQPQSTSPVQTTSPAPALKDSVARVILQDQRDLTVLQNEQLQLVSAFDKNQASQGALSQKLQTELASALKDSGLDPEKYVINAQTLVVTAKPIVPSVPTPVKPATSTK